MLADAESLFKGDIRQLKEWELVTERIEKERLRGYRDNKRKKFRGRGEEREGEIAECLRKFATVLLY